MTTVDIKQQSPLLHQPKESPRLVLRLFTFVLILLPVSALIVAFVVTPESWEVGTWPGTVASLCCLVFIFCIGIYVVVWNPKVPKTRPTYSPSWAELAIWGCEAIVWLLLSLLVSRLI
jgi:hypothetical protein